MPASSVSRFEGAFCDVDVTIYELKTRALQAFSVTRISSTRCDILSYRRLGSRIFGASE